MHPLKTVAVGLLSIAAIALAAPFADADELPYAPPVWDLNSYDRGGDDWRACTGNPDSTNPRLLNWQSIADNPIDDVRDYMRQRDPGARFTATAHPYTYHIYASHQILVTVNVRASDDTVRWVCVQPINN
ncbi:hypothetical protein IQ268_16275 [Oculatella sp. LEGE 06141]|uniref:hypothetical protein n=1 Tax=Oculatella sp. LEGE 06141 TaxID=1828648 RepID=UPI00187FC422|nr:hypothetical protein [Oculatella sp. LEGE 06141]MBE9180128.1 hypothetical protein [Oculatella sp. LEGE 06141]